MRDHVAHAWKGLILFIISVAFLNPIKAATYYFSSGTGDDYRSNQQAQNPATPWKSLNKLNSILSSLNPGDSILFKRGEIFDGFIIVSNSGNTGAPIIFSAYGSGDKPVISGFTSPSAWTQSGNIWETDSYSGNSSINVVLINGIQQQIGRYPNRSAANGGYLTLDSYSGNTSITDNELTSATNWSGGEVVIRKNHWVLDRNVITQHSGSTISYISESGYWSTDKFGYFIQNHPSALDEAGEWYYKKNERKLGIYSSVNPVSNIKVSTADTLVYINNRSNIVFIDLRFTGANTNAFELKDAQNIRISNCEILFTGVNAVNANSSPGITIENTMIDHSNNNALNINWCQNAVVRGNKISNTGTFPGLGKGDSGSYESIMLSGDNSIIELNSIENTGYVPLTFSGNSITIKNNFISNFAMIKDDGGGIYTWNNGSNAPVNSNRKVTNNIVINGIGAAAGTDNPNLVLVHGIYIDDNADHVEISGNTVANCGKYGLFLHNAKDIIVQGNTFYNNEKQVVFEHDDIAPNAPIRNIVSNSNIFFSKLPVQTVAEYKSKDNDLSNFGTFDNNYYCRPFDDELTIGALYKDNGTYNWSMFDLEGWRKTYNKDVSSKKAPKRLPLYKVNNMMGLNQFSNGGFTNNISGLYSFTSSGNCTTTWVTASKLDGGALQVSFTGATDATQKASVIIAAGSVKANKTYILKFSLLGSDENKNMEVFLRKSQSPYNDLGERKLCPIKASRTENEYVFIPTVAEGDASIVFDLPVQNTAMYLDNIQLTEANIKYTNPDDSIRFEYNNTNAVKNVTLNGKYIDAKSQNYSGSISLAPFTSVVLISNGAADPVVSLPSRFVSFTGEKKTASVDMQWKIATDQQIDRFEVERSPNGSAFTKIVEVKAAIGVNDYKYTDEHPNTGINYYRIKLVNTSGEIVYSIVIHVDFAVSPANPGSGGSPPQNPPNPAAPVVPGDPLGLDKISINPNFVTDRFCITVADDIFDPKAWLLIVSSNGSLIRKMNLSSKKQSIDVASLISGMYVVSYQSRGQVYSKKFIKAPH